MTDAFELEYMLENRAAYDRLEVEGWFNRTRFAGNAQGAGKRDQFPFLDVIRYTGFTDVDSTSTGYRAAFGWGDPEGPNLTIGTDLRYVKQELNEIASGRIGINVFRNVNSPIPKSRWSNPGLFLERSRYGLALRAVGERPEAAHARGIGVWRTQTWATLVGGALVGIGGAAFTLDVKLGWSDGHIDGFGWIALAIVIFGGWRPGRVLLGCWLFGALQVVALRLQPVFPGVAQILPSLPFPLMIGTLVVLNTAWLQGLADRHPRLRVFVRSDAPSALGVGFQPD